MLDIALTESISKSITMQHQLGYITFLQEILKNFLSSCEKIIFRFFFKFFEFTRERIKVSKRFWYHSMCFLNMYIVSKFKLFIDIFTVVKLQIKTPTFLKLIIFRFFFIFWVYKRTNQSIETILISFDVFFKYVHCF